MSSVGSISSGSGLNILQFLQQLSGSANTAARQTRSVGGDGDGDDRQAQFQSTMSEALKNIGVSDQEISSIQGDLQTAMSQAASSSSGSDKGDAIRSAIDTTLEKHGVDLSKAREAFRSIAGPPHGGPPPGGKPGGPGGPGGAGGASASGSSSSTDSTDSTQAQTLTELIQQLLESNQLDSSTRQLLTGLLPSVDATA